MPIAPFCTDEDVAVYAGADFADLAPGDQALAAGNDGAFLSADRWTLTSASADFEAQGVAAGMVAVVALPRKGTIPETQCLVVASVSASGVTLRRKGLVAGQGQPPAPAAGCDGVSFTIATLGAQIAEASYDLNHRLGIDDAVIGRAVADLSDVAQLRRPCILAVLATQYEAIARSGNPDAKHQAGEAVDHNGARWAKARNARRDLDDCLGRLVLRWHVRGTDLAADQPTTRFSMRLSR